MMLLKHCWLCSLMTAAVSSLTILSVLYCLLFGLHAWKLSQFTEVQFVGVFFLLALIEAVVLVVSLFMLISIMLKFPRFLYMIAVVDVLFIPIELAVFLTAFTNTQELHVINKSGDIFLYILRTILNISSLVCVQSVYSEWNAENFTVAKLESLEKLEKSSFIYPRSYQTVSGRSPMRLKLPPTQTNHTTGTCNGARQNPQQLPRNLTRSLSSVSQYKWSRRACRLPTDQQQAAVTPSTLSRKKPAVYPGRCEFSASHFSNGGRPMLFTDSGSSADPHLSYMYQVPALIYAPNTQPINMHFLDGSPQFHSLGHINNAELSKTGEVQPPSAAGSISAVSLIEQLLAEYQETQTLRHPTLLYSRQSSQSSLETALDIHRYMDVAL